MGDDNQHWRDEVNKSLGEISAKLETMYSDYISQARFIPIERITYGLVAIILTAVLAVILAKTGISVSH